jgi:hypothetical protein
LIIKRFYFTVLRLCCRYARFGYLFPYSELLPNIRKHGKFPYLCPSEKKNRMDRYRQMYNENFLGTSDISILKFYYASFKIQQGKGNVSDVGAFLDECAKISDDTNMLLKLFGFLPLLNLCFGTGKEQKRIAEIIRTKRKNVEKLFLQDNISDEDVQSLLYDISPISQANHLMSRKESLQLVKEYILKCYSIQGKKQLGDRIFGYLLKSELLQAYTPEERLSAWHTFIGNDLVPSDTKLHANPRLNRSRIDSLTLAEHLESILDFYNEIGLEKAVTIIRKDMEKLTSK